MRRPGGPVIGVSPGRVLGVGTEARAANRRDDMQMTLVSEGLVRRGVLSRVVIAAVLVDASLVAASLALDLHLRSVGRGDLSRLNEAWLFVGMVVATIVVGAALAQSRPTHPMGWLFLALGTSVAGTGFLDSYATQGLIVAPGSLPGASAVAVFGSLMFVPWLVLIALILHLTPTGRPLSRPFAFVMSATVVAAGITIFFGVLSNRVLAEPFEQVTNPMAAGRLAEPFRVVGGLAVVAVGLGVLVAAFSLIVRFRRARGIERLQLLWLAVVAIPVPVLMGAAFVPGHTSYDFDPLIPTAGIVVLISIGTGLSVQRYRLYAVERILSRTLTYGLLTGLVVGVFLAVTLTGGALLGRQGDASRLSVAVATLAAVGVAEPGRRLLQDRLDRRFDRRRYGALSALRRHLDAPEPVTDIQAVLREALGDDSLEISYPLESPNSDQAHWVTSEGRAAGEAAASVEVLRGNRVVARVVGAHDGVSADIRNAVFRAAATELDNAGLRAALAVQLVEVRQSRARLAAGQHEERRRIERNLHDGAQQRLLALALELRASALNGSASRLRTAVDNGIEELRAAVVELRALANGVCPTVLADGGLLGALEDLADRGPFCVTTDPCLGDLAPDLEETAWFIVCEAVTNAQKHAAARIISITAQMCDGVLAVAVSDDGTGGADSAGHGLRGLRDRAEAIGGTLEVTSATGGTTVKARLPCAS